MKTETKMNEMKREVLEAQRRGALQAARTPELINAEYAQVCAELGDITVQMEIALPKARAEALARIALLDEEMAAVKHAAREAQKVADFVAATIGTRTMSTDDE